MISNSQNVFVSFMEISTFCSFRFYLALFYLHLKHGIQFKILPRRLIICPNVTTNQSSPCADVDVGVCDDGFDEGDQMMKAVAYVLLLVQMLI